MTGVVLYLARPAREAAEKGMNVTLIILEIAVLLLGLGVLLHGLWLPPERRRWLGYLAAAGLLLVLGYSFARMDGANPQFAFGQSYVLDSLALFFKRLFLVAAAVVLVMSVEWFAPSDTGQSEFYALTLFALAGMMFAASANDFVMLFVSIELIAVTFYVLVSYQRRRLASLEAGVKYLILGALVSALMVYGVALVYGASGTLAFGELAQRAAQLQGQPVLLLGLLLVLAGLAFKIAAFPMQMWVPDVYQGAPTPVAAWLAVGSKAAGVVLGLRVLLSALPREFVLPWAKLLMGLAAITILYGSLGALPQRNLKRLLGYSSIANAGYLLLGVAVLSQTGTTAVLYFLAGYVFTLLAAFGVLVLSVQTADGEDIAGLAGLGQRSPFLAATLTLAMVSLAGVPPLAGFFGKFLLIKSVLDAGPAHYWVVGVAVFGVVVSLWYYFGVIRAIYWMPAPPAQAPLPVPGPLRVALAGCLAGMVWLGLFPSALVNVVSRIAGGLQ